MTRWPCELPPYTICQVSPPSDCPWICSTYIHTFTVEKPLSKGHTLILKNGHFSNLQREDKRQNTWSCLLLLATTRYVSLYGCVARPALHVTKLISLSDSGRVSNLMIFHGHTLFYTNHRVRLRDELNKST